MNEDNKITGALGEDAPDISEIEDIFYYESLRQGRILEDI